MVFLPNYILYNYIDQKALNMTKHRQANCIIADSWEAWTQPEQSCKLGLCLRAAHITAGWGEPGQLICEPANELSAPEQLYEHDQL